MSLSYSNIREFIERVNDLGELRRISGSSVTEVGPISLLARKIECRPAVLFDDITSFSKGCRVFANTVSSPKRIALALGFDTSLAPMEVLRLWKDKKKSASPKPPIEISDARFTENILENSDVDCQIFPAPRWHEFDGAPYIGSGSISIMRDPDENWVNLGIYRLQIHDRRTLAIHFDHWERHGYLIAKKYWDRGGSCPVAIVCGEDPALFISAMEGSPWGVSEFGFGGWLRGEGIEVVQSDVTGLPLPASSEIIIEGEIPAPQQAMELEGPFGEATGYYAGKRVLSPIVRINRIMYRNDPILTGNPPLRPPYHTTGIPLEAANIWSDLEKAGMNNVQAIWKPTKWITAISIRQTEKGQPKRVGEIAVVSRGLYLDRIIVVVDEDVNPMNPDDVLWAISTRCEPANGITIYPNLKGSTLDPLISPERAAKGDYKHSKMLIDACKPFDWKDKFPSTNDLTGTMKDTISKKWLNLLIET